MTTARNTKSSTTTKTRVVRRKARKSRRVHSEQARLYRGLAVMAAEHEDRLETVQRLYASW